MARKYFHKPPSNFSSYRETARTIRQIDPNAQNFKGIMLNKQQQIDPQYMLMESLSKNYKEKSSLKPYFSISHNYWMPSSN